MSKELFEQHQQEYYGKSENINYHNRIINDHLYSFVVPGITPKNNKNQN